ncbi:MAG: ribokinase [Candidatus Limnocylindrales bacterium]
MPSGSSVLVIGSVNIDHVVTVGQLPAPGETVSGGRFERHHGGKGANQAVAAARMGASVRFVGAVGDDEDGRSASRELQREGVDTVGVATTPGVPTGVALIVVDSKGENQIAVASGANAGLSAAWVQRALAEVDLDVGVVLLGFEVGDEPLIAATAWAGAHGIPVLLNPSPVRPLAPELLAARPVLVVNQGEALQLSPAEEAADAAQHLAQQLDTVVVLTVGARGAFVVERDHSTLVPSIPVKAVDTTGAGDTLAGVLAAELARGEPILEATRTAVAAAAFATTQRGAREGMPSRTELRALTGTSGGSAPRPNGRAR